jgi:hypothetical protein
MRILSPKSRSATTNNPLRIKQLAQSIHARRRRVRDLYTAMMDVLGDGYSDSVLAQAAALQCAELRVIGERLRAEMLAKPQHDLELSEELVRVENMIRRTENELTDAIPERKETHQEFIRRVYTNVQED